MSDVQQSQPSTKTKTKMQAQRVDVFYGDTHAIRDVSLDINDREVLALMGPSGCGKSTMLRCLNRMNDSIDNARVEGRITLDDIDIYDKEVDPVHIRARVGMVAQVPNPFPKPVFDNVAFGPRLHGLHDSRKELAELVEHSLSRAGLWEEVKDQLHQPGTSLSGGQQQRLSIARAIANRPDVLLMDEPVSSLDPKSAAVIEDLIRELSERFAIVLVTHSMEQAKRIADRTAFFYLGDMVEVAETHALFENPQQERTQRYLSGLFG
ncbi:MAG: phosphate ABC transporter ATP-binding protein PstB [Halochromatium sp.]|uniref:phosphate ABC transporter ATP-binding protein PstB n=1 Tax=Halochromatium sp. TaxID=2049430 RepID=UPI00397D15FA